MKQIMLLFLITGWVTNAFCQNTLGISGGAQLHSSGGAFIVLHGSNLVNDGILQTDDAGIVLFTGSKNSSFSGMGHTQLGHLRLQLENTNTLDMQSDVYITNEVNFSGGRLNLNDAAILLGSTGTLNGESETSHAFTQGVGTIQAIRALNAPAGVNPGNLGAVISSASNLGSTTIVRGHATQTDATGRQSIGRYYIITPTNNTNLDATLRFTYLPSEVNGSEPDKLSLWKNTGNANGIADPAMGVRTTGNLGSSWSNAGYNTRGTNQDYLERSGIQSFTSWTLFDASALSKSAPFTGLFALYPNPAVDQTMLNISSHAASKASLRLIDGNGVVVRQKEVTLQSGTNQVSIDLSGLARGVYTLNAIWDNNSKTVSILKK